MDRVHTFENLMKCQGGVLKGGGGGGGKPSVEKRNIKEKYKHACSTMLIKQGKALARICSGMSCIVCQQLNMLPGIFSNRLQMLPKYGKKQTHAANCITDVLTTL